MDYQLVLDHGCKVIRFAIFVLGLASSEPKMHCSTVGIGENIHVTTVYEKTQQLRVDLEASVGKCDDVRAPRQLQDEVTGLRDLVVACKTDCERLLGLIRSLNSSVPASATWDNFKVALRKSRKVIELQRLEQRVHRTHETVSRQLAKILR